MLTKSRTIKKGVSYVLLGITMHYKMAWLQMTASTSPKTKHAIANHACLIQCNPDITKGAADFVLLYCTTIYCMTCAFKEVLPLFEAEEIFEKKTQTRSFCTNMEELGNQNTSTIVHS